MPLCRPLGKGLWEVRSDLTQGRIARVLFCIHDGRMVLLHGFIKKTQKTPAADIEWHRSGERNHMKKKGRIGPSFDEFLKEKGLYEEVTARAIKRVIARQLDALMQHQGLTKASLAKRMRTSRAQLDRLLDPDNESVTLGTLTRAAQAVGRHLRLELI
jgi:DNA-binding Xre family transcriptional regulator